VLARSQSARPHRNTSGGDGVENGRHGGWVEEGCGVDGGAVIPKDTERVLRNAGGRGRRSAVHTRGADANDPANAPQLVAAIAGGRTGPPHRGYTILVAGSRTRSTLESATARFPVFIITRGRASDKRSARLVDSLSALGSASGLGLIRVNGTRCRITAGARIRRCTLVGRSLDGMKRTNARDSRRRRHRRRLARWRRRGQLLLASLASRGSANSFKTAGMQRHLLFVKPDYAVARPPFAYSPLYSRERHAAASRINACSLVALPRN